MCNLILNKLTGAQNLGSLGMGGAEGRVKLELRRVVEEGRGDGH